MTNKIFLVSVFSLFGLLLASPAHATETTRSITRTSERTTTTSTTSTTTSTTTPSVRPNAADLDCMQKATTKRDAAIIVALDKHNAAWKTSLEKRSAAVVEAWKITDKQERKDALNDAWKTYKKEKSAIKKTYNKERLALWKTFRDDRKACGPEATKEDTSTTGSATE